MLRQLERHVMPWPYLFHFTEVKTVPAVFPSAIRWMQPREKWPPDKQAPPDGVGAGYEPGARRDIQPQFCGRPRSDPRRLLARNQFPFLKI